jgi:hypothetical protein
MAKKVKAYINRLLNIYKYDKNEDYIDIIQDIILKNKGKNIFIDDIETEAEDEMSVFFRERYGQ